MHRRQLIGSALIFALHAALSFSANAGQGKPPVDQNCEANFAPKNEVKRVSNAPMRVGLIRELNISGNNWLAWKVTPTGEPLLAVLNGTLKVFSPAIGADPMFSATAEKGALFTGASWSPSIGSELVAGDNSGNLWRFEVATKTVSKPEFQGSSVDVLPSSFGNSLLLGLGNLARARIMPVGSVVPERDYTTSGSVVDVQTHRTVEGRNLAAVVSAESIQVFDLDSPSDLPIFERRTISNGVFVKPQWIIDDAGESALAFQTGGVLVVEYPLSEGRPALTREVHESTEFQTLRTADGEVLFLLTFPDRPVEIIGLRQKIFFLRAVIENSAPGQGLIESPSGTVFVAYMAKSRGVNSRMHIARLSDVDTPVFTLTFETNEVLKHLSAVAVSANRHLLAVGTSAKVHVLELRQ